jgi:hypothetical protein
MTNQYLNIKTNTISIFSKHIKKLIGSAEWPMIYLIQ